MSNEPHTPLILVVDDDPIALELVEGILEPAGYAVSQARTGEEALASVRERKPDLVLLDVMLPDLSGFEVCERLVRSLCPDVPVVFQTASREVEDKRQLLSAGAADSILKPFARDVLLAKVAQHLRAKDRWNRLWKWRDLSRKQVQRSEFPRFKEFLAGKFPQSPQHQLAIEESTVGGIYALAPALHVSTQQMARWIGEFLKLPYLEAIACESVDPGVLPASFCRSNYVVALEEKGAFVVSNPFEWPVLGSLLDFKDRDQPLKVYVTEPEKITALFRERRQKEIAESGGLREILQQLRDRYGSLERDRFEIQASDAAGEPIILLVNRLIEAAHAMGASDIHIEPAESEIVVRYRVDGDLRIVHRLRPCALIRPLASRIKIMCGLDISERRLPQDGRIVFKDFSKIDANFDLRVSTAPMQYGEKIVMRIVDKDKSVLPLSALGFSERHLSLYREKIRSPYGMILHVGPTGSGKSMTLYAALNEIQRPEINIVTAEDPIEYSVPGINQMQVNPGIGLTFSRALRCYLRQDPDIVLLGEIRDVETAEIAVEASLTGHLLLSTLHTNDAPSTVTRLIQMGIEPFMVSSSIVLVCAQRLVRRLCPACKEAYSPPPAERQLAVLPAVADGAEAKLWRPRGCPRCSGIGYRGRVGIHEVLVPNDSLRLAINERGVTAERLRKLAVEECGLTTLWWDAMEKARLGVTAVEEVVSKVRQDEFDSRPAWMRPEVG